jgi:hypothetical protein
MVGSPQIFRGDQARLCLWSRKGQGAGETQSDNTGLTHTAMGVSDFSITLDKGTVEQELVGEVGNYTAAGSLSVEGSLTACKLDSTAAGLIVIAAVSGQLIRVSGSVAGKTSQAPSLSFYFVSCLASSFDISMGDADTISEGSIDFTVMDANLVTIKDDGTGGLKGIYISDDPDAKGAWA